LRNFPSTPVDEKGGYGIDHTRGPARWAGPTLAAPPAPVNRDKKANNHPQQRGASLFPNGFVQPSKVDLVR
jgi:hypothetical protein